MQSSHTYRCLQEDNPCQRSRKKNHCNIYILGCFTVVWWIGEVEESFIHIVAPVPFAEETRLNKFQPNPNRFRGPAS